MNRSFITFIISIIFFAILVNVNTGMCNMTFHLSFEDLDFIEEDFVSRTGLKTVEERKLELVEGRFGKGLYLGSAPLDYDIDNMSGIDLDLVTAIIFNVGFMRMKGIGYDEPFLWGAGKLHPACGTVAFWVKGPLRADMLFNQSTCAWGRLEKRLIQIYLEEDGSISAYVEDARYVQHKIRTEPIWKENQWQHIVFTWDRAKGLELLVNGVPAATTIGMDSWWENQRSGLFHLPMSKATYDEFYLFDRPLTKREIKNLYKNNRVPKPGITSATYDKAALSRLKNAFISDVSSLPNLVPSNGEACVFNEITPERIHDEGVQGWWLSDGRYEIAWPHTYSIFTIIPGDVDFHAEKADILPPAGSDVNYITFEGNLDGVKVFAGNRSGNFMENPVIDFPKTNSFFRGITIDGLKDSELRIAFTKSYGAPPGFESDVLQLPLSGDLRIHEVGLFNVSEQPFPVLPGDKILAINSAAPTLDGRRYPHALKSLYTGADRTVLGLYENPSQIAAENFTMLSMTTVHLMNEPAMVKYATGTIILDMWVQSHSEENIFTVQLLDPAVPSHTWTHAEARLIGFTGGFERLRLALKFDPAILVPGDRLWLKLMATDGLTIKLSDSEKPATLTVRPLPEWITAEPIYAIKTLRPNILTYGRMFEYMPWEWTKRMPDVDAPENFGGPFDMMYPWQAVMKVNKGNRLAKIYRDYGTGKFNRRGHPTDMSLLETTPIPEEYKSAPEWAWYFKKFQTFRNQIVTWWRHHQRSDGQAGGGWNDDTLIFSRTFGDLPYDSNPDALALYNNVFEGFDKTNYFKDGYCRIHPIDRLHNGDFVRERYKSLVYNLGEPRSATWAMEEAWHWGKPDKTPINYGNGKAFLFGKDVLEWYWGRRRVDAPFQISEKTRQSYTNSLKQAADAAVETALWRYTEAWVHTDDQYPLGTGNMQNMISGGFSRGENHEQSHVTITIGIGWIQGGGHDLARMVEYSGNDSLKVRMYSFDKFDRNATIRLYRLDPGKYNVTLHTDNDRDGTFETMVSEEDVTLVRFDRLDFKIPPQVPSYLEVKQIKADPLPGDLPDLAISPYFVKKEGNTLSLTIHNIGCAPTGPFTCRVHDSQGNILQATKVASLGSPTDFVSKKVTLLVPNLPESEKYFVVLDPNNEVKEIFEENNTVTLDK